MTHTVQEKVLRILIFNKFNKMSHEDLARRITEHTGIPTNRCQVAFVLKGKMKSPWIRHAIAEFLDQPEDQLFFTPYIRRGAGRRKKAA